MEKEDEATTGRRELRKQERREAIIKVATESFIERGYAGTSMSGLLDILGGSKATLWGYFRSKEELFAAVIEDATATFRAEVIGALAPAETLEQGLFAFCRTFIRCLESPEGMATGRLVTAESRRFPEVGRIFYERAAGIIENALAVFLQPHCGKRLRDAPPNEMAVSLMSLCAGRQTRMLWGVEEGDPDRVDRDAARIAELFLRGYAND